MTHEDFLEDVQQHVANIAIGTSTLRGLGKGTMQKARDYLSQLNLTRLKSIEPSQYTAWLETRTSELRETFTTIRDTEQRWGPARKVLNIFLCHAYLNRFLSEAYCLDRLADVMETPLDRRAAIKLIEYDQRTQKGRLPKKFAGITKLRPEKIDEYNKYQEVASELAADYAKKYAAPMRRACLDIVLWPNDGKMKIVASRNNMTYLIMVGDDPETADGIIVRTQTNERFPPYNLQSIYGQGYWEECEHSDELLARLMAIPEKKL